MICQDLFQKEKKDFYYQLTIIQISGTINNFRSVVIANTLTIETIRSTIISKKFGIESNVNP